MGEGIPEMVWEKGQVEVGRVQRFWPTAPAQGQPGGTPSEHAHDHAHAR
jgi:lariat debranching enzyme